MDSSIRASAFAGLGALILSIIISAFSKVQFGIILIRALVSGFGFALLVFAAIKTLSRFIPELLEAGSGQEAWSGEALPGSRVDIVLSEEGQDMTPSSDYASAAQNNNTLLNTKELKNELHFLDSSPLVQDEIAAEQTMPRPSVSLDDLDSLPDLDNFSDSFASQNYAGDENEASDAARENAANDYSRLPGPSSSMPSHGNPVAGTDTAALAKAVQTLLRKDQKGP